MDRHGAATVSIKTAALLWQVVFYIYLNLSYVVKNIS